MQTKDRGDWRVCILDSHEQDKHDTYKMAHHLRGAAHRQASGSPSLDRITTSRENPLVGLLTKGSLVLVVLGAECFDAERHVVHPRGLHNLEALLQRIANPSCGGRPLVVVVAESYKCQREGVSNNQQYFHDHLDRIDVYSPDLIDIIVSDELLVSAESGSTHGVKPGILPHNWLQIVHEAVDTPVMQVEDGIEATSASGSVSAPNEPIAPLPSETPRRRGGSPRGGGKFREKKPDGPKAPDGDRSGTGSGDTASSGTL